VIFGARGFELPGTLTTPAGKGPFAALVLVHGSGPQDRDETIGPNKPFRDLAEGLSTAGIVVLRYDKRTRVHGGRGVQTVNEEAVDDAVAAAAFVRTLPDVDRDRVFVLGHSLGGHLVPRIVDRDRALAGAVIFAGSVRPLQELVREQAAVVAPGTDPQALVDKIRGAAPESYWKDLENYDPAALAARQRIPLLILQGERDYQVTMTDFRLWQKALAARKNVSFKSYRTLNHLFLQGNGPRSNPAEYNQAGHVDEVVVRDIATFLLGK
jgi:dienelactone hydrolase